MLSTLIYRSRVCEPLDADALGVLVRKARARNASLNVTGILLFDGVHFVQLLEGGRTGIGGAVRGHPAGRAARECRASPARPGAISSLRGRPDGDGRPA
ncbi:BLUF domain-containing protein [Achromobacter dolens]|uniref:BLUF domain-containing protein n=1 Tax=Achromobacter dolens TaxID=1287738 RepID=UPI003A102FF0